MAESKQLDLTLERWRRIDELAQRALELTAAQRATFIANACAGDSRLQAEVEQLLDACDRAEGFLEQPAFVVVTEHSERPPTLEPGTAIGPYRILHEISRGGMGEVYLAARADEQFHKQVAVKIVRYGLRADFILRHFQNERRILAALNHECVARLIDAGVTADGLPYIVMDYVDGKPINRYCDKHRFSIRDRLRLFLQVCAAVEHAHNHLIVHRDLKPSNILVTAEGVPKLLDFGIAKLLSKESEGADEPPTGALMRILTPEYASPEQVKGEPVNLASDIYSLGVLLYELLTGHRPYRLKSHAPEEVMRAVCEEEPLRPSVVVASHTETIADASQGAGDPASAAATSEALRAKLRRQLSGDLDNILLKALQKEPRRRYASVAQLSDDLRRHLEGLPVSARRATFPYLAEKFVRRHKTAVAVAAAFILVSIGFTISLALQSVRVARERDRAEAVSAFLVQLFQVSNPDETKGNTITAREVLDEGAERISRELRNEPEVQARLMYTMGRVYYGVGLLEPADSLLRAALAIQRDRLGNGHLDTADTLHALAVVLARKFDYAAEPLFREALAIEREQLGAEHPRIATTLHDFGALLIAKRDYPAAEQVLQEALAMRHRLFGQKHADISDSLNWLAILYSEQGDYAKAAPLFREALAMRKELLGDDHPLVRQSMHNLACSLRDQGDYEAAEALFLQVLPERQKVWPKGHPELATTLIMLGLTILERGSPAEAEPFLREGVEMRRRMLPPQAWETAVAESDLGACLAAQERFKEAEPLLVNSFPIIKTAGGERDKRTISALKRLASLYTDWRKPHKAAFYLEELAKLNESLP